MKQEHKSLSRRNSCCKTSDFTRLYLKLLCFMLQQLIFLKSYTREGDSSQMCSPAHTLGTWAMSLCLPLGVVGTQVGQELQNCIGDALSAGHQLARWFFQAARDQAAGCPFPRDSSSSGCHHSLVGDQTSSFFLWHRWFRLVLKTRHSFNPKFPWLKKTICTDSDLDAPWKKGTVWPGTWCEHCV